MASVSEGARIKNELLLQKTGLGTNIACRVNNTILRWFSHIEGMDEI